MKGAEKRERADSGRVFRFGRLKLENFFECIQFPLQPAICSSQLEKIPE
jgi:hypothetical protein